MMIINCLDKEDFLRMLEVILMEKARWINKNNRLHVLESIKEILNYELLKFIK